jgi:tetratricopeptide (TPR) repeat protein
VQVVAVACDELGRSLPLQPVLDLLAELVRLTGPDDANDLLGPDHGVLGPLLGAQGAASPPAQLVALTDPGAGQALLFSAVFSALRRWAGAGPLLLLVDDAHLADSATVAWLAQAPRRLADARVAVVAAGRAEEAIAFRGAKTVTLGPLDLKATAAVVGQVRAAELHARSGGNPLFLVELAAAEEGGELPASIRNAVDERCARAGAAAATLRAAAVIGPEVDLDLLTAATGATPRGLLDHLEEGVRRRFLVEQGTQFVFAHALVREALEAGASASRAAYIHREVSRALGARPGSDPLVVAYHARLGGEVAHASAMLVKAARLAVARFDQEGSLRLLDEALALNDTVEGRLERARVCSMSARYEQAAEDIDVARSRGCGAEALEVAAWSKHFQRRFEEALSLADQGAALTSDVELRASCLSLGGWVSLATGDFLGAESRLEAAVGVAAPGNAQLAGAWLAWLRMNQGSPFEALGLVKQQAGQGLASYRFPNAYALMVATMALAMQGRPDEALATLGQLAVEVTRMGARRWAPRPLNLRGWIARNLGETGEADELNQAAIEAARPLGLAEPVANSLLDLASGRLVVGDLDGAARLLDEAAVLAEVEHAFRWRHQLRGRLVRARLDLALSELGPALEGAGSLALEAERLGAPRYAVQARLVAAMAARRAGERADLDAVDVLLRRLGDVAGLEAWWVTAEVARVFGVPKWESLARARVGALRLRAGDYAQALERAAGPLG